MQANRKFANWLDAWIKIFEQTNIPKQYVLWAGIFTLAAAMQNRALYDRGLRKIYPNLYVWAIGEAGSGKSIPAEWATEILRVIPDMNVHSGELTKIYMLKYMQASSLQQGLDKNKIVSPTVTIHSDELAVTVGSEALGRDLLKHLVQMYTVPGHHDYGTDKHGAILLESPLINWIACSTVPWLNQSIPRDLISSGLIARVNTITAPLPTTPPRDVVVDKQHLKDLVHDLLIIATLKGEFTLEPPARIKREEMIDQMFNKRIKTESDMERSLFGREDDHALKIAMSLSASTRNDLIITEQMIDSAYTIVNYARDSSMFIYTSSSAAPKVQLKMKVLRYISRTQHCARSRLLKRFSDEANAEEINVVLRSLLDEGLLTTSILPSGANLYSVVGVSNGNPAKVEAKKEINENN